MKPKYNDVESAILTTLVVENKQSINHAVNKINRLYSDAYKQEAISFAEWVFDKYYFNQNTKLWFDYYTPKTYTTEQLYEIFKNK